MGFYWHIFLMEYSVDCSCIICCYGFTFFRFTAYTMESDDALDAGEEYSKSGAEVQYVIASGLTAVVTVDDYEYKKGTGGSGTSDSGTNSKLTIKASF